LKQKSFFFRDIFIKIDKPTTEPHAAITKNINKNIYFKYRDITIKENIFIKINSINNKTQIKFRLKNIIAKNFKKINKVNT